MKILSAEQCKQVDQYTIEYEPIQSIDLMERAADRITKWIIQKTDIQQDFYLFAGPGNNGGDALAIARLLAQTDHARIITVIKCFFDNPVSEDCQFNLERIDPHSGIQVIDFDSATEMAPGYIIDGVFGTGLTRPILPPFEQVVRFINASENTCIAIDCPSGLLVDTHSLGPIVEANATLTIGRPKLALFLPQSYPYVGHWELIDIDYHKDALSAVGTNLNTLETTLIQNLYRPKGKFDHKGTNGTCLLNCGSTNMTGAAILAAKAAMRSGAGKVHVHSVKGAIDALRTTLPEAILHTAQPNKRITFKLNSFHSIGVGCGLGRTMNTYRALQAMMFEYKKPMVVDADALNIIGSLKDRLKQIPKHSILTPHPKEFERLFGKTVDDFDRLDRIQTMAKTYELVIVLKGANTTIALPSGEVYFNLNGNPGMATAGSGDVLTGILTALLAQGYPSSDAALLGVYIHGLAGDIAFDQKGSYEGVIASDIIDGIPKAFGTLYK